MLECTNLTKSYKKKCVVNNLSFRVEKGEIFAFLGSNGAGKTTTIKMILGLVDMDSGRVEMEEGIRIGYSPETPYFPPFLTGGEVLDYYAGIQKIPRQERREEITKLLDTVGQENSRTETPVWVERGGGREKLERRDDYLCFQRKISGGIL